MKANQEESVVGPGEEGGGGGYGSVKRKRKASALGSILLSF